MDLSTLPRTMQEVRQQATNDPAFFAQFRATLASLSGRDFVDYAVRQLGQRVECSDCPCVVLPFKRPEPRRRKSDNPIILAF